jgi:hypothetical protein
MDNTHKALSPIFIFLLFGRLGGIFKSHMSIAWNLNNSSKTLSLDSLGIGARGRKRRHWRYFPAWLIADGKFDGLASHETL